MRQVFPRTSSVEAQKQSEPQVQADMMKKIAGAREKILQSQGLQKLLAVTQEKRSDDRVKLAVGAAVDAALAKGGRNESAVAALTMQFGAALSLICGGVTTGSCIQRLKKLQLRIIVATDSPQSSAPLLASIADLRAVRASGGFFALAAFLVLAVAAAAVLFVMALMRGFWVEKKSFLALLAVVAVGAAVGVARWTLVSTGYVDIPSAGHGPIVALNSVDILGHVASLMFLLLLSLFAWILLAAVIAVAFEEQKKLSLAVGVALAVIAMGTISYSIAMTVIGSQPQADFVVNASGPLIPGVSFLFCTSLTAMWAVAWRLVEKKHKDGPGFSEMRRNAIVFLAGSAVLAACFLSWSVVALLELVADYYKYHGAARGLEVTSLVLTVLAVLAYTGSAVIAATRVQGKNAEYVPLHDEAAAPARYAD